MAEIDVTPPESRIDTVARRYAHDAMQAICDVMYNGSKNADRLAAAETILRWAYGTPGKATINLPAPVKSTAKLHGISDADLIAAAGLKNKKGRGGSTPQKGGPKGGGAGDGTIQQETDQNATRSADMPTENAESTQLIPLAASDAELEARIRKAKAKRKEDITDAEFTEAPPSLDDLMS